MKLHYKQFLDDFLKEEAANGGECVRPPLPLTRTCEDSLLSFIQVYLWEHRLRKRHASLGPIDTYNMTTAFAPRVFTHTALSNNCMTL